MKLRAHVMCSITHFKPHSRDVNVIIIEHMNDTYALSIYWLYTASDV